MSNPEAFQQLIKNVTDTIGQRTLDPELQAELNKRFPHGGDMYQRIFQACKDGIEQGWMCKHEGNGIRFGRIIKPTDELSGYSVDVVDMQDTAGPHHRHPNGEIDLIMPLDDTAEFDGHPGGWLIYGPDSSHSPTVTKGRALILYLLPQGKIEFTRT
ncbi:MAG TPA: DUF4863 family protein [Eoetvoesiella sp.]